MAALDSSANTTRLFRTWQERRRIGKPVTPEELCADAPDALDALKEQIAASEASENQIGTIALFDDSQEFVDGTIVTKVSAIAGQQDRTTLGEGDGIPVLPNAPPGYEFLIELGRGGMGVVFKARDLKLNRIVAVKMVLSGDLASPQALVRFLAEAEALAALQHPNVVHVHERGQHQGLPYFVMEFCPGGSLGAKVREHPLPARTAAELVEQLARAVAAAHARNIVHRDLKPENVLFDDNGSPKIADFGLAKRYDDSKESADRKGGESLTQSGAVIGTPSYMSPEQARGESKKVGPGADVWALGAILYRIVTGRPPFLGANPVETLRLVMDAEPIAPGELTPGLPRDIATIALKCLTKDPVRRYSSAADLADDLRRFLDGKPIVARPVGAIERAVKWVKRNPVITGATLAVMLALSTGAAISTVKYLDAQEQRYLADRRAREADDSRKAEARRVQERDEALKLANTNADELKHQLGVSNMVLAAHAFDDRNVILARDRLDRVPIEQRTFAWNYLARQVRGGVFTLYGHAHSISSVAYSPDGTRIATGSWDRTARVWDARTGTIRLELVGHKDEVKGVAFSPDNRRIVTGSGDHTARIWDARTGAMLLEFKGHKADVTCVAFSPDGLRIVTGGAEPSVRVWDSRTGTVLLELVGHRGLIHSVAFDPDGSRIVTASGDRTARVWDAQRGKLMHVLTGHARNVFSAAFSPDGFRIVTGSADSSARVWNAATGIVLFELRGHSDGVREVAFSPDATRIVTASYDQTARVWHARTAALLMELKGHTRSVSSAAFSPDGLRIVTGSDDHTAKVWDAQTGAGVTVFRGHTAALNDAVFSPDGTKVLTASVDKTARVWNARTGTLLFELSCPRGSVSSAQFSPDGSRIVTSGVDQPIRIWDATTGKLRLELNGARNVRSVAFRPDGIRFVAINNGATATVWDAHTGVAALELPEHGSTLRCAAYSPDGSRIVIGCYDNEATVWNAETGVALFTLIGHTESISSVAYSSDGLRILTASEDRSARICNAHTGKLLTVLDGHTDFVQCATFSPDGSLIATASNDRTIRIWDARTATTLIELKGHASIVRDVAFSPDGSHLVSASLDHSARVWDAKSFTNPIALKGHPNQFLNLTFSPDGTRIVTDSPDSIVKVWDRQTGALLGEIDTFEDGRLASEAFFSRDGTRIVTIANEQSKRVWDSETQKEIRGEPIPELAPRIRFSPDGRRFALPVINKVELIPVEFDADDFSRRLVQTRAIPWRYVDGYNLARQLKDHFATKFYLDRLLSLPEERTPIRLRERNILQVDPRLIARAGFYQPDLSKWRYDRTVLQTMAAHGDRLAKRVIAQERLRDGEAKLAIPLLFECLLSRPANSAPVEELLLAHAWLDMDQRDDALRFYRTAIDWLDRPRNPIRAANIVSHSALNPWPALVEAFVPTDDPRRHPFDWESWHECDVFRSNLEKRLKLEH